MKLFKITVTTLALCAAAMTTSAQARDSFSLGINIGGDGHHHRAYSAHDHHHAPIYHGYYSAPRVIYYGPSVSYRHHAYYNDRHYGYRDRHHYQRHGNKHYRQRDDRGRGHSRH